MNDVVATPQSSTGLALTDDEMIDVMCASVYPGAARDSVKMVLLYCRARGLDPLQKPVHIVPMDVPTGKKNEKGWDIKEKRDVLMPGINLYRVQAEDSGQFLGTSEPEFGPIRELKYEKTVWFDTKDGRRSRVEPAVVQYPEWCKVTAFRRHSSGTMISQVAIEYWTENYATKGRDSDEPNDMWKRRARGQLAKCFDPETEILTDRGFERFDSISGRVLQVTESGLSPCDADPFSQDYDGEMIVADGSRLNFSVTPNHDMLITTGKIEASELYDSATTDGDKFLIPRAPSNRNQDAVVSDSALRLLGYFLADGSHTGYNQMRISVSRPRKVEALRELALHSNEGVKRDGGRTAVASSGRIIATQLDKATFTYDFALLSPYVDAGKNIDPEWALSLSGRQARIIVDAVLSFDGSENGNGVRRLTQRNVDVIRGFELLAVHAGYSISGRKQRSSDIGAAFDITVSESDHFPVVRGVDKNRGSLIKRRNVAGKVWCVTVPSGVIVVRRYGFSMLCGNCAEAQALRKAFSKIVGGAPTAEEMVGKQLDDGNTIDMEAGADTKRKTVGMPEAITDNASPTLEQQTGVKQGETVDAATGEIVKDRAATTNAAATASHAKATTTTSTADPNMASDGERKHILFKLKEAAIELETAMKGCGITDFEKLTKDGFTCLKDWIKENAK